MGDYVTDYEKICDFQNLYKAHINARKGKRSKTEVIKFELDLAKNLTQMHKALVNKSYKMRGYYHFTIHEPKTREIFAAYYPDRVLLHCICDEILLPLLQKRVIHDNAACQLGKGTHFAMKRLTGFMQEHFKAHGADGYILKCDISKYFASIDQAVLKARLNKIIVDKDIKDLLFHYINSYATEGRPGKGLPLGNQSSQWFAVYYLDPVDRLIKEKLRIRHYSRYMDDLILLHPDKEFLKDALTHLRSVVEGELKLTLNEKTQIFPLRNGVEFLGWRFYLTDTGKVIRKLKAQSKLRYKRRLMKLQKDYFTGAIELEDVKNSLASYQGHLMHGHTYKLKAHVLKEFILKKTGILSGIPIELSQTKCRGAFQRLTQKECSPKKTPKGAALMTAVKRPAPQMIFLYKSICALLALIFLCSAVVSGTMAWRMNPQSLR